MMIGLDIAQPLGGGRNFMNTSNTMNTINRCVAIIAVCCAASTAWSQVAISQPASQPASAGADQPKLIQMTVTAQDTPEPALKYHLLPTIADHTPGNSVLMYYLGQAAVLNMQDELGPEAAQKQRDQIVKYLGMPLSDLPVKEVEKLLEKYSDALRQVELGAMREEANWGLPLSEGYKMDIPPLGQFRNLGRVLALRARLEILQGRADQAIHTIQIGISMGRHVGHDQPVLISGLVGIGIETVMLDSVQELISQGGPNMYWALASLPQPLVDSRQAVDYELHTVGIFYPEFRKAMAGRLLSKDEGTEILRKMAEMCSLISTSDESKFALDALGPSAIAMRYYAVGKRALIQCGRSLEQVEAMPAGQVVAIYLLEDYLHWADEIGKWCALPYPQAMEGSRRTQREFDKWNEAEGRSNLLTNMIPTLGRCYFYQTKLDRTRAALQTIESIRSYAARQGKLPQTLDQLELPAPNDPITGQAFLYEVQGTKFTLVGPVPEGLAGKEGVRYGVTLTPAATTQAGTNVTTVPTAATLPAGGQWQGIDKFIQDETVAVIRIDLVELTSEATWQQISTVVRESKLSEAILPLPQMLEMVRQWAKRYVQAGVTEVFMVVNTTDWPEIPMIVVPIGKDVDPSKLAAVLSPPSERAHIQRVDGALVMAADWQLRRLSPADPAQQAMLIKAIGSSTAPVRLAVALSDSTRRAMEETLASLPPELGSLPGTTLTRDFQWACLSITVQPEISLHVVAQSPNAQSANALGELTDKLLACLVDQARASKSPVIDWLETLPPIFRPQARGDKLVLELSQARIISILRDGTGVFLKTHQPARPQTETSQPATSQSAVVMEGVGYDKLKLGMSIPEVIDLLGQPDKRDDKPNIWLQYRQSRGIDILFVNGKAAEIRFNEGFAPKLSHGPGIGMSMEDVFQVYGRPIRTIVTTNDGSVNYGDRVLCKVPWPGMTSKIEYAMFGVLFWFDGQGKVCQFVVVSPGLMPATQASSAP
jgi:hypothetical protein